MLDSKNDFEKSPLAQEKLSGKTHLTEQWVSAVDTVV
jgi:hypothetical protein